MKLSDAFHAWTAAGCPPLPDDQHCGDHEAPDDLHTQVCRLDRGHDGPHRDVDEWPVQASAATTQPAPADEIEAVADALFEAGTTDAQLDLVPRLRAVAGVLHKRPYVDVVFDGPPDHDAPRFVEVEELDGRSIDAGQWIDRRDGTWALRIPIGTRP